MGDLLKPCPFCGARLERSEAFSTRSNDVYVHPADDLLCVTQFVVGSSDKGRVAAWNRRVPDPDQSATISRLEAEVARKDAEIERLIAKIKWAHDALYEINPANYDHDEVCKLNDASVEVILGLAPLLGRTHGKTPKWWAARAAALANTTEEGRG